MKALRFLKPFVPTQGIYVESVGLLLLSVIKKVNFWSTFYTAMNQAPMVHDLVIFSVVA